jgi:arginase family enzyme
MDETGNNDLGADPPPDSVVMVGIPFDDFSTFLHGAAKAPALIRETLHDGSSNLFAENGVNLDGHPRFSDFGDLASPPGEGAIREIDGTIKRSPKRCLEKDSQKKDKMK